MALPFHHGHDTKLFKNAAIFSKFGMAPRPLAPARAMRSRTCVDVIQPCRQRSDLGQYARHTNEAKGSTEGKLDSFASLAYQIAGKCSTWVVILEFIGLHRVAYITTRPISDVINKRIFLFNVLVENVEDLLQLSDEYQVKQHIFDPCVKFLEDQPKTKENVMKIVALAKLYNLDKVHQGCIDLLKNMGLESLQKLFIYKISTRNRPNIT